MIRQVRLSCCFVSCVSDVVGGAWLPHHITCFSGWSWKLVRLSALQISTRSPAVNVYFDNVNLSYSLNSCLRGLDTCQEESAVSVGHIWVRRRYTGHAEHCVVVLCHCCNNRDRKM